LLLEVLAVVIMPLGDLDVEDVVIEFLDVLQVLCEHSLELKEVLGVLWALGTSKHWHDLLLALPCELELCLTDLHQVLASLNESFVLCKDGLVGVELPILS